MIRLLVNNFKLKQEVNKLIEENEKLKKFNNELQKVNYEISYNNIDLIEQRKKYQKRCKQLKQELIEERYKNENK